MSKTLEQEAKELEKSGKLKTVRSVTHYGKHSHKQIQPKTAKKWSLGSDYFVMLKFSYFWKMVEKGV